MYLPYILALLLIAYIFFTQRELDRQRKKTRKAYIAAHLNSLIKSLEDDYEMEKAERLKLEAENQKLKEKLKAMDGQIRD